MENICVDEEVVILFALFIRGLVPYQHDKMMYWCTAGIMKVSLAKLATRILKQGWILKWNCLILILSSAHHHAITHADILSALLWCVFYVYWLLKLYFYSWFHEFLFYVRISLLAYPWENDPQEYSSVFIGLTFSIDVTGLKTLGGSAR